MIDLKTSLISPSQREKMRSIPLPWVILLLVVIGFLALKVWPVTLNWLEKKEEILNLEPKISQLQLSVTEKRRDLVNLENEFKQTAAPYLVEELQIFPESIDIGKVSKVLELYGLQLAVLDANPYFKLNKLSFGNTTKVKDKKYAETALNIEFISDHRNFETFIRFLQSGKLSKRLAEGKDAGRVDITAYKFLENNLLPLLHIQQVRTSSEKADDSSRTDLLRAKMIVKLFSQN